MTGQTACGKRWAVILSSFERNFDDLSKKPPYCIEDIRLIHAGLVTIGQLIQDAPLVNGDGLTWRKIISKAEDERSVLVKHLEGKALFTALLHLYATTHRELSDSRQPEPVQEEPKEEIREQRRRKRNTSDEQRTVPKNAAGASGNVCDPRIRPQAGLPTRNCFAPLRTGEMDIEGPTVEVATETQEGVPQQKPPT
jgi:hypothetical protein